MNKIICDICGTAYEESLTQCPICGCSKDFSLSDISEDFLMDDSMEIPAEEAPRRKSRPIFDYDEVNQPRATAPDEDDDDFDEEEEYEEEPRSNTALVVILLVLIVLLLVTAGFFFLRYFLPNMTGKTEAPTTIPTTVAVETAPPTTEDQGIPCTDIVVPGGKIELVEGGKWLMNVQVFPEDTTDQLVYVSADENVVTVSEDGTVTAVAEGQTVIVVTCGTASVKCNVLVDNALAEETVSAETVPAMQAENTDETTPATQATESAQATEGAQEAQPTEATTEATIPEGEVLKLKKTDITMFGRYSSATLELDCSIPADKIYWFTMDSTVAIVNDGVVTATGSGITRIYGEYEGQQVECIVRCNF